MTPRYPLIKQLGIKVHRSSRIREPLTGTEYDFSYVSADDLEKKLSGAPDPGNLKAKIKRLEADKRLLIEVIADLGEILGDETTDELNEDIEADLDDVHEEGYW